MRYLAEEVMSEEYFIPPAKAVELLTRLEHVGDRVSHQLTEHKKREIARDFERGKEERLQRRMRGLPVEYGAVSAKDRTAK